MKRCQSFVALILSILLPTDSLRAGLVSSAGTIPSFSISIPSSLGYISETYIPSSSASPATSPDIILIQDLHVNRSVQFAISGILKRLKAQGLMGDSIAVEGATGIVELPSQKKYPDALTRKEAADYLVSQGEMPGAMHFVVTEGEGRLFGIETDEYYQANLDMFRQSYNGRMALKQEIEKIQAVLPTLKKQSATQGNATILEKELRAVSQLITNQVIPSELLSTLRQATQAVEHLKLVLPQDAATSLLEPLSASINFYTLALLRNDELFKNAMAVRRLGHQKTTIVVTGGFHTEAIAETCKRQGLSYAVITPTVKRHDKTDQRLYIERLMDHHLTAEQAASGQDWVAMFMLATGYRVGVSLFGAAYERAIVLAHKPLWVRIFSSLTIVALLAGTPLFAQAPFSRQVPRTTQQYSGEWARFMTLLDQELPQAEVRRIVQELSAGIDLATDPQTSLVASHRGDTRIGTWGFTYDNVIGANVRILLGQTPTAEKVLRWYRQTPGVQKLGGVVTAVQVNRPEGMMAESHVMSGPEAHRLISELHTYEDSRKPENLQSAIQITRQLLALQNTTPNAYNFGAFRMGPKGDPRNPADQHFNFNPAEGEWYNLYNTEHNNDIRRAMRQLIIALQNEPRPDTALITTLEQAIRNNQVWRRKMYDPAKHLFYLGTTDVPYRSGYWGMTFEPGKPIPLHPGDATFWGLDDVDFLESLEPGAIVKIRQAIDDNFMVTVPFRRLDGQVIQLRMYGFMTNQERLKAPNYENRGPSGDQMTSIGIGRAPIGTFEWSSEVDTNVDLGLFQEFFARGRMAEAEQFLRRYIAGVKELRKADAITQPGVRELPYATEANRPAWEWNTPFGPNGRLVPSVISNLWRVLGETSADIFRPYFGSVAQRIPTQIVQRLIGSQAPVAALRTNSQQYVRWDLLNRARAGDRNAYEEASTDGPRMFQDHPDWVQLGRQQNGDLVRQLRTQGNSPIEQANAAMNWWPGADRQIVFNRFAVNDAAAMLFITVEAHERLGRHEQAVQAAIQLLRDFPTGLVWDPQGWFWSPAISMRNELSRVYADAVARLGQASQAAPAPGRGAASVPAPAAPTPNVQGMREIVGLRSTWPPSGQGNPLADILEMATPLTLQAGEEVVFSYPRSLVGKTVLIRFLRPNASPDERGQESSGNIVAREYPIGSDGTIVVRQSEIGAGPWKWIEGQTGNAWRQRPSSQAGMRWNSVSVRRVRQGASAVPVSPDPLSTLSTFIRPVGLAAVGLAVLGSVSGATELTPVVHSAGFGGSTDLAGVLTLGLMAFGMALVQRFRDRRVTRERVEKGLRKWGQALQATTASAQDLFTSASERISDGVVRRSVIDKGRALATLATNA